MKILLAKIMYNQNLSVRQVAAMTGLSKSTVSRIANGETSPTADMLERLAIGLNVRVTDLFESDFK